MGRNRRTQSTKKRDWLCPAFVSLPLHLSPKTPVRNRPLGPKTLHILIEGVGQGRLGDCTNDGIDFLTTFENH